MHETDNRDRGRARSLLALGPEVERDGADRASPTAHGEPDAVMRHRMARSRREAAPSPYLAALARSGAEPAPGYPPAEPAADRSAPEDRSPPPSARGLRAMIRDRLLAAGPSNRSEEPPAGMPPAGKVESAEFPEREWEDRQPYRKRDQRFDRADLPDDRIWRPLIDPMTVISGVVNSRTLIVATTLLGAVLGVAIALSTPKKYEAVTEILVDPRDLQLVERDLTGSNLPSDATLAVVENQARVLTSGTVLNEVVDKLNLTSDPEFNGKAGSGFSIGAVISELRGLLSRRDVANDEGRVRSMTINNLADGLSVERGGKTFVISVGVKTRDPEKSALIANTMTSVFLEAYGKIQADTAGRATAELTSRLDELRSGVEAAERKVEDFKARNDLVDARGQLISDDEILKLNEQLSVARARTMELNAKAESTKNVDVGAALSGTLPEELTSNVMIELRAQYATLQQEANRLSVQLGPRHPRRLAIQAQLDGARRQIANELRRIVSSSQTELKRAVQLEQELSSRLAQLKVKQGDVSGDQVDLRELEREAAAKRAVYEAFLLRARQTSEQKDINTANISVISKAYPPLDPVGPSRSIIAITGTILGMFAGIGIGATRGAIRSLRDRAAERWPDGRDPGAPRPNNPGPSSPSRRRRQRPLDEGDVASGEAPAPRPGRKPSDWLARFRKTMDAEGTASETPPEPQPMPAATQAKEPMPAAPSAASERQDNPPTGPQPAWQPAPPVQPAAFAPMPVYGYPPVAGAYPPYPVMPQPQFWQPPMPYAPPFQAAGFPMPQPHPVGGQGHHAAPHADAPVPPTIQAPARETARPGPHAAERAEPAGWQDNRPHEHHREPERIESIDEIRQSLREFREAVDDLSRSRARPGSTARARRYS